MPFTRYTQLYAALLFYKHNCIAPFLITALCCFLYATMGDFEAQYVTKVATDAIILYFIFLLRGEKMYYYYNLHISKWMLIICFFIIDLLLFSICLWTTRLFI